MSDKSKPLGWEADALRDLHRFFEVETKFRSAEGEGRSTLAGDAYRLWVNLTKTLNASGALSEHLNAASGYAGDVTPEFAWEIAARLLGDLSGRDFSRSGVRPFEGPVGHALQRLSGQIASDVFSAGKSRARQEFPYPSQSQGRTRVPDTSNGAMRKLGLVLYFFAGKKGYQGDTPKSNRSFDQMLDDLGIGKNADPLIEGLDKGVSWRTLTGYWDGTSVARSARQAPVTPEVSRDERNLARAAGRKVSDGGVLTEAEGAIRRECEPILASDGMFRDLVLLAIKGTYTRIV